MTVWKVMASMAQESLGIANRLALEGDTVIMRGAVARNTEGLCHRSHRDEGMASTLHELPPTRLASELFEGGREFAKRWGVPIGREPEEAWWSLGCLVWYRKGEPVFPPLLVLAERYALSGDWGPRAMPAALVLAARSSKLYRQTHRHLRAPLGLGAYTGPLTAWTRVPPRGAPVFEEFDPRLGGLAVEASIDLSGHEASSFLGWVYGGSPGPAPSWPSSAAAGAIRLGWLGYPGWVEIVPSAEIGGLGPRDWPHAVRREEDDALWTAGPPCVAADLVAVGSPSEVMGNALSRARKVELPQAQARSDALFDALIKLRKLEKRGYW